LGHTSSNPQRRAAGGLNILPQKSWNVYGRENRLKVSRDEAKHADEERERQAKQRQVRLASARVASTSHAAGARTD
jgi:hypothetical protein